MAAMRAPSVAATTDGDGGSRSTQAADPDTARPGPGTQPPDGILELPAARATFRAAAQPDHEIVFWQSIVTSTNPADFEAYLEEFPDGVFRRLAQNRIATLAAPVSGRDARERRPGDVFRDCAECPEIVVLPGGQLAMGRYEVTAGEYRAFATATGGGAGGGCDYIEGYSWRDPGFRQNRSQTDRHPVVCVNWNDAHEYLAWLSTRTGATYRLPSDAEWDRAAAGGQQAGCYIVYTGGTYMGHDGTCPVGSYGLNAAGPVGYGRKRVGMDDGLLRGRLRTAGVARRQAGESASPGSSSPAHASDPTPTTGAATEVSALFGSCDRKGKRAACPPPPPPRRLTDYRLLDPRGSLPPKRREARASRVRRRD